MASEEQEASEVALSPTARLFHSPRFNCHIISIIGFKTTIDPGVIKLGLQHTLIKHPRFSSKLVVKGRRMKWTPTTVNLQDHIIIPNLDPNMDSPDQFIEDYISHLTTIPMDLSRPLWEIHLLNFKTSNAEAVSVLKMHHSIGDGASLMSLLLACTRKTSDPESLPTIPVQKRAGFNSSGGFWGFFLTIWMVIRMIWNTLVDLIFFGATILVLKDTKTSLKGSSRVDLKPKRIVYRTVSLDDIKLVRNKMKIVASAIAHRFLSNTTMAFSNVVGPLEEISFYGHPISFLAPSVYGHPHALTIHYQSYFNKMTIVVAVDPDVIPHPHNLCDHLEESLNIIRDAVKDKGLDAA